MDANVVIYSAWVSFTRYREKPLRIARSSTYGGLDYPTPLYTPIPVDQYKNLLDILASKYKITTRHITYTMPHKDVDVVLARVMMGAV